MKQKKYHQEFKQTVVELYCYGQAVSDLAREYSVSEVTIYKRIKLYSPIEGKEDLITVDDVIGHSKRIFLLK